LRILADAAKYNASCASSGAKGRKVQAPGAVGSTTGEIKHYRWWLERELEFITPHLVVALGATATQALAGKAAPVMKNRGPTDVFGPWKGFITVHPSSLLRQPDEAAKAAAHKAFVADLARARAGGLGRP
jgi:uracil-DNA glycosylase family 4